MGLEKAFKMDLDEVLDKTEVVYQTAQSIYTPVSVVSKGLRSLVRTMILGDNGALSASAISTAFWLTLPCLVRIVLSASVKLFCLCCLVAERAILPLPR